MKKLNVLIADDELPARGELRYQLSQLPGVTIIGEAANGKEVLAFLKTHPNVDLIFLDIEMPVMTGLEAAKEIARQENAPKIVFATGYSQFALQAFELEAFDYILKPYDEERIARAVERLQDHLALVETARTDESVSAAGQKMSLQTTDRSIMISPAKDVILVSSEKSGASLFYTTNGIVTSRMTLRDIENLLVPMGFFRTHKGYIVNLSKVVEIQPQDNSTLLLTMEKYPKEKVPVSRHYIKDFRAKLNLK